ncbi:MAG: NusG domain II-containing protein [Ruminococcaceae bacterium]|nr:NusG domain II-containing protein [Oscillospiraceae bacterium]
MILKKVLSYMTFVDKISIIFLLVISLVLFSVVLIDGSSDKKVIVEVNGVLHGEYDINATEEIDIDTTFGHNKIKIEKGTVTAIESSCDEQREIGQKISKVGQSIICLPNCVIIRISGNTDIDGVTY